MIRDVFCKAENQAGRQGEKLYRAELGITRNATFGQAPGQLRALSFPTLASLGSSSL
jgi:hypothetical protein